MKNKHFLPPDTHAHAHYDKDSEKGYILKVSVKYPKEPHKLHSGLPFLTETMKTDKCEKNVCNLFDKKDYVKHIRALKRGLILNKVHRVIKINQEAWLKSYIDMNTELRTKARNDF